MKQAKDVPSIPRIQKMLVDMGDKEPNFEGSRSWIGTSEAYMIIDELYKVPCRILTAHGVTGLEREVFDKVESHLKSEGSPVMMGGVSGTDNASKCIVGTARDLSKNKDVDGDQCERYFLIVDPHYSCANVSRKYLEQGGWVGWKSLKEDFVDGCIYNLCLPLYSKRY